MYNKPYKDFACAVAVLVLFFVAACATRPPKTADARAGAQLFLLPTLHGYHALNTRYNYDTLKAIIRRINPDVIAVEIRQDDLQEDTEYLKKSYPLEMRSMRYWFPGKEVVGFDWLGKELQGKKIPPNYWKEHSMVKKLERAVDEDPVIGPKLSGCYHRTQERDSLLQHLSLPELLQSADADIVREQYACYEQVLTSPPYNALVRYYRERNQKLLENIQAVLRSHPGKRIVVLTGDDHYVVLKEQLRFDHDLRRYAF